LSPADTAFTVGFRSYRAKLLFCKGLANCNDVLSWVEAVANVPKTTQPSQIVGNLTILRLVLILRLLTYQTGQRYTISR
jgi:hypothetical protein